MDQVCAIEINGFLRCHYHHFQYYLASLIDQPAELSESKSIPLFSSPGIGYAGVLVMQYINIYYTVILGWAFYFMFASFQSRLPWSHCGNEWNTPNCVDYRGGGSHRKVNDTIQNVTLLANETMANASKPVSASQEYWE